MVAGSAIELTGTPSWKPASAELGTAISPFEDGGFSAAGFDSTLGSPLGGAGGPLPFKEVPPTASCVGVETAVFDNDNAAPADAWPSNVEEVEEPLSFSGDGPGAPPTPVFTGGPLGAELGVARVCVILGPAVVMPGSIIATGVSGCGGSSPWYQSVTHRAHAGSKLLNFSGRAIVGL